MGNLYRVYITIVLCAINFINKINNISNKICYIEIDFIIDQNNGLVPTWWLSMIKLLLL